MKDPFSSVENMLQWQIDLAKKRIKDTREALNECGEIYPLPKSSKPTDGLPDNWAFGKFTQYQIATAHAIQSLDWVSKQIEQAEIELASGNLPIVIYSIIKINQSINSASSMWASSSSIRIYRHQNNKCKTNKINSKMDRTEKPTKEELIADRDKWASDYLFKHGTERVHGWKKLAQIKHKISSKTLNKILK